MERHINITYKELDSIADLSIEDRALVEEATKATESSHSPFSNFRVGVALRLDGGELLSAANQENEAFPSGLCAERSAIFYAFSKYPDTPINTIAIIAKRGEVLTGEPTRPCGACIQVMLDAENRAHKPIRVILASAKKVEIISSVHDLLPFSFDNLK